MQMYFNFKCIACKNDIQTEYANIGQWVQCPLCATVQGVPDPILPVNSEYFGYRIQRTINSDFLWTKYHAVGETEFPDRNVLLCLPTSFFLNNSSDFQNFANIVIRTGVLNSPEFPKLLDTSLVEGKTFFCYSFEKNSVSLETFVRDRKFLKPISMLTIAGNIASALDNIWRKYQIAHKNLNPKNIRIISQLKVIILDTGVVDALRKDQDILARGLDIRDYRYVHSDILLGLEPSPVDSDIHALGALMFFMATGKPPFDNIDPEDKAAIPAPNPLEIKPDIDPECAALITDMMDEGAEKHPKGWEEIIERIKELRLHLTPTDSAKIVPELEEIEKLAAMSGKFNLAAMHTGRYTPVGHLTQKQIKLKKETLKQFKKVKRKPTETIAQLVPREVLKRHAAALSAREKKAYLKLIALIVFVFIGLAGAFLIYNRKNLFGDSEKSDTTSLSGHNRLSPVSDKKAEQNKKQKELVTGRDKENHPVIEDNILFSRVADNKSKNGVKKLKEEKYKFDPNSSLGKMIIKADKFFNAHPEKYDEAIKEYQKITDKAVEQKKFDIMDVVRDRIIKVEDAKKKAIEDLLSVLSEKIKPLVKEGKFSEAINVIGNYKGKFEKETAARRKKLIHILRLEEIRKRVTDFIKRNKYDEAMMLLDEYMTNYPGYKNKLKKLKEQVSEEKENAEELLRPLFLKIAPSIVRGKVDTLTNTLNFALLDSKYYKLRTFIRTLFRNIETYGMFDKLVAKYFENKQGKKLNIEFRNNVSKTLKIEYVKNGKIYYSVSHHRISVKKSFLPKDLSLKEQLNILSEIMPEDNFIMSGLLALRRHKYQLASKFFMRVPLGGGKFLSESLAEYRVETIFIAILKQFKLPFKKSDPQILLRAVATQKINKNDADKLYKLITRLRKNYQNTEFLRKHSNLFDALESFCKRFGAKTAINIVIDEELLKESKLFLNEIFRKATPFSTITIKKGKYKVQGTLYVDVEGINVRCEKGAEICADIVINSKNVSLTGFVSQDKSLTVLSSTRVLIKDCVLYHKPVYIKVSSSVKMENCFSKGLHIINCENVKINHCTILTTEEDRDVKAAFYLTGGNVSVINSIIYGTEYGALFKKGKTRRNRKFFNTLWYGAKAIASQIKEDGSINEKRNAVRKAQLRRFVKIRNNIYKPPQFLDERHNIFTLVKGVPGSGAAADKLDCGRIWVNK